MVSKNLLISLAVLGLLQSGIAMAQGVAGVEPPTGRFATAPELGEQFPDVAIVDDEGNPVSVRELASRSPYTVLTLGCLT